MLPTFAFAAVLSAIQIGADSSLATPGRIPLGALLYGVVGLAIGTYFTRGDMSAYWPEINAQWNAIYTLLVPLVWFLAGRRASYSVKAMGGLWDGGHRRRACKLVCYLLLSLWLLCIV
jgi:hypothetical protein